MKAYQLVERGYSRLVATDERGQLVPAIDIRARRWSILGAIQKCYFGTLRQLMVLRIQSYFSLEDRWETVAHCMNLNKQDAINLLKRLDI